MSVAPGFFDTMAEHVTGEPWTYGVILVVAALDAFFPVVPSETVVITAGTLAAAGDLILVAVIPAAAVGAFLGDNVSFFLGDRVGEPAAERLFRGRRSRERLEWATRMLDRHGAVIIVAARFIPGGRTATTFSAGMLDLRWRRFLVYAAVAAVIWASYAALVGYLGGRAFRDEPWKGLLLGFGLAAALAVVIEGYRRIQARRGRDLLGRRGRA